MRNENYTYKNYLRQVFNFSDLNTYRAEENPVPDFSASHTIVKIESCDEKKPLYNK